MASAKETNEQKKPDKAKEKELEKQTARYLKIRALLDRADTVISEANIPRTLQNKFWAKVVKARRYLDMGDSSFKVSETMEEIVELLKEELRQTNTELAQTMKELRNSLDGFESPPQDKNESLPLSPKDDDGVLGKVLTRMRAVQLEQKELIEIVSASSDLIAEQWAKVDVFDSEIQDLKNKFVILEEENQYLKAMLADSQRRKSKRSMESKHSTEKDLLEVAKEDRLGRTVQPFEGAYTNKE